MTPEPQVQQPKPPAQPQPQPEPKAADTTDLDDATEQLRVKKGIPRALVDRLRQQESGGNISARSPAGAEGEWQVMPATFDLYNKKVGGKLDRNKPLDRAYVAFSLLSDNYNRFHNYAKNESHAWGMALAGYHGSADNVMRDLRRGGYGIPDQGDGLINTRDYVYNIMKGLDLNKPTSMPPSVPDVPVGTVQQPKIVKAQPQQIQADPDVVSTETKAYPSKEAALKSGVTLPKAVEFQKPPRTALTPGTTPSDLLARPFDPQPSQSIVQQKFKPPPSLDVGASVQLQGPSDRGPTNEEAVNAYLTSLGPEYAKYGAKHREETGVPILHLGEGQIRRGPNGTFWVTPTRGAIDYLNKYVQSGGNIQEARTEAERQQTEQQQAASEARKAAEPALQEIEAGRKGLGQMSGATRSVLTPTIGYAGGKLKELGGLANLGGIAPNKLGEYLNTRGAIMESGAQLPPLTPKGEEIARSFPEKAVTKATEMGLGIFDLIATRRVTGMKMGQIMAVESWLKNSDRPVEERAAQAGEAYAMGTLLDEHAGRIMSGGLFGVPKAVTGAQRLARGDEDYSKWDYLLDVGLEGGTGALLGGKEKEAPQLPEVQAKETLGIARAPSARTVQGETPFDAERRPEPEASPYFLRDDQGNPVARVLNPEEAAQGEKVKVRAIHHSDLQPRDDSGQFAGPPGATESAQPEKPLEKRGIEQPSLSYIEQLRQDVLNRQAEVEKLEQLQKTTTGKRVVTDESLGTVRQSLKDAQRKLAQAEQESDAYIAQLAREKAQREPAPATAPPASTPAAAAQTAVSPEQITQAAVKRPDGTVETGPNHPSILERLGVTGFESPESRNTPDFGFVAEKGRFIEREEAARLATATGQNLKTFEANEPAHSDEIAQPGKETPISEGKKPPQTPQTPQTPQAPKTTGIARRVEETRREALGQPPAEPGQGISAEDSVNRGRELLKSGSDPQSAVRAFRKNKSISADAMALVRARHEELAQAANKAFDKYGVDSPEFKKAEQARADWYQKSVKPMQTEWHKTGMAQQGETAIDTGTFYGLYRAFKDRTGREMPPQVARAAEKVAAGVAKADNAVAETTNAIRKELGGQGEREAPRRSTPRTPRLEQIDVYFDRLAQEAHARLKARTERSKTEVTGQKGQRGAGVNPVAVGADIADYAIIGAAKLAKGGIRFAEWSDQMVRDLGEEVRPYLNQVFMESKRLLDEKGKQEREAARTRGAERAAQKSGETVEEAAARLKAERGARAEARADIEKHFQELKRQTDSESARAELSARLGKGGKITPEDTKAIWAHTADYIGRGMDFTDARNAAATDLGITSEQVMRAITSQPKVKRLTDQLYRQMSDRRSARAQAEAWVKSADTPVYRKVLKSLPDFFFGLKTFGHGTVGMVTHAGKNIFIPSRWADYWPNFARQYRLAYGRGYHERMMTDLVNGPNFITAKRAGLANDPHKTFDDYQRGSLARLFGKAGLVGARGFDSLKLLRQDLFDSAWNKMPDSLKTPEMAELTAREINHSTGVTKMQLPRGASTIFFAPSLEGSRWAWVFGDNAKALKTFAEWNRSTPEEQYYAKMVMKRNAEFVATYGGLLALNQGLLMATGSKDRVNFTDPTKGDWLRFKIGGRAIEPTGGIVSMIDFLGKIGHASLGQKDPRRSRFEVMGKAAVDYGRGKLSPIASTATDVASQSDFTGRPLPFSSDKGTAQKPRYTWPEYLLTQQSPIPFGEAWREIYHTWKERGLTDTDIGKSIAIGILSGGTGIRIGEEYQSPQQKQQDALDDISKAKYGKPFEKLEPKERNEVYKEKTRQDIQKAKQGSKGVSQLRRFNMTPPIPSQRPGEDSTSYQARLLRLSRRVRDNLDDATEGDYWDLPVKAQRVRVTNAVNSAVRAA